MDSKRITKGLALLLCLGLTVGKAMALEGNAERGKTAAAACIACHQADGSGMNLPAGESWPRLAGMNASYIVKQMHDFKDGRRKSATMQPFADMLDDRQIIDVAAYFSQMPVTAAQRGDLDEALLRRGEQLAVQGDWDRYIVPCKSCHGPRNEGAGGSFPGIASQHAGYIEEQLRAWQAGERSNDPQNMMEAIAKRMNEDDVRAVSAWLADQTVASE